MVISVPKKISSLKALGNYSFSKCVKLTDLETIGYPGSLTEIPEGCFSNCEGITEIEIPEQIEILGAGAFYSCGNLTKVTIPCDYSYPNIDAGSSYDSPFTSCINVTEIHYTAGDSGIMPDISTDSSSTYDYYSDRLEYMSRDKLKNMTFDEGITHIAANLTSFYSSNGYCNISKATFPSTVIFVGKDAFRKYDAITPTFYGYGNTAAETYANNNSINFVSIGDPVTFADTLGCEKGASLQIDANAYIDDNEMLNKCIWSLAGNNDKATTITKDGLLTVSEKETATDVTIAATYNEKQIRIKINIKNPAFKAFFTGEFESVVKADDNGYISNPDKKPDGCFDYTYIIDGIEISDDQWPLKIEEDTRITVNKVPLHHVTYISGEEATCTDAGHISYYDCDNCDKLFADELGINEISSGKITIPALEHGKTTVTNKKIIEPELQPDGTYKDGSLLQIITCTLCDEEISRSSIVLSKESIPVKDFEIDVPVRVDIKSDITTIPDNLTEDLDKIKEQLRNAALNKDVSRNEADMTITYIDAELNIKEDDGNWLPLDTTSDVTIILPYPDTVDEPDDYEFVLSGIAINDSDNAIELLEVTKEEDGLKTTLHGSTFISIVFHKHEKVSINGSGESCTNTGLSEGVKCSICNQVLVPQEIIPSKSHDWSEWKTTTSPTCTANGVETRICACGKKETRKIDMIGHDYKAVVTAPTCTEKGYTTYTCACGDTYQADEVAALGHSFGEYVTTMKAGFDQAGEQTATCSVCQATDVKAIAAAVVPTIKDQAFNNKNKTPKVTVVNAEGNVVKAKATFANKTRKAVGKYKVTVKLTGADYEGSKNITFKINPAGKSISKLSKGKKAFTVKWKKASTTYRKQMTGYQIRYSTSSKMTKAKTVTVKNTKATSKTIKKLKVKKTYYVQLRTYKTVKGAKYYSSWSKTKKVKTK